MRRKSRCQQCGRSDVEVGPISRRGLCSECGLANYHANIDALTNKQGPAYRLYAKRQSAGYARYAARLDAELDGRYRAAEQGSRP